MLKMTNRSFGMMVCFGDNKLTKIYVICVKI